MPYLCLFPIINIRMNNIRKSIIFAGILTLFYGLYYWAIPSVINIEKRIDFFEQKIEQKTGYKINIESPKIKMGLTPAIWFMSEETAVLNDDGTKALSLNHSAIKINFLPLLIGRLQIGNFSADSISANLTYTKDGNLKLGQYDIDTNFPKTGLILSKAYFRIGTYKFKLDDLKKNKRIFLDGNYLTLDEFKINKRIKLATFAKLFVDKKSSDILADFDIKLPLNKITENQFKLKGRISNLDLADFSEYIKPFADIESISGKIDFIADTTMTENKHKDIIGKLKAENFAIMKKELAKSIYCKDKIEIATNLSTTKNGLKINSLDMISKGINLAIDGKIKNLDAKFPYVDTNVVIKDSRTESFIPLMPGEEDLIYEANLYALKKNPFYGNISGNLNVKGRADTPDVIGKIHVTDGVLNKPLPYNTPKATVDLDFQGQKMYMDVKVPAPINQKVYVKGWVNLYNDRDADLQISSTETVDLKTAQIVLNPLHEILKFELGPVPIMDIRGIGNINLHIIGNKLHPHGWGQFNFKDTTASFLDIHNMELTKGSGTLEFQDEDTHFYTTSAFINSKPVTIDGKCSLSGNLNFDVGTTQDLGDLLTVIKTSPMLKDIQEYLKPITYAKGKSDLVIKLTGTVKDIYDVVFNKNIFAKGSIELASADATVQNIPMKNISGKILFENLNTTFDLKSNLENSVMDISGKMNEKNANIKVTSDKFVLKDALKYTDIKIPYKEDLGKIHASFVAQYFGPTDKINPNGINLKGNIYQTKSQNFSIENVSFNVVNSFLKATPIKGYIKDSPYTLNISASNLLSEKQNINGNFNIQHYNLKNLSDFGIKNLEEINGVTNLKGQIKNNGIYTDINLDDINLVYAPEKIKVHFSKGKVQVKKDTVILSKITAIIGEMPVFANGKISDIFKSPTFDIYVNAKPTQDFMDQFFNNKSVYPIKLKGDVNCTSAISGTVNALRNKTQLKLGEDSSVYYMGATLGSDKPVNILADNTIYKNGLRIHNFQYDKLTTSQNKRQYFQPQLLSSGYIEFLKDNDLRFHDFKVVTKEPTDAKIFNLIFRKPIMKQGIFTSDITLNGKTSAPVIFGKLHVTNIDMPLLEAKINDVDFNFKKDKIYLTSKGNILANDLTISSVIKNSLTPPFVFEDIQIYLEEIDLNKIAEILREYDVDSSRNLATVTDLSKLPDLSQIIINKSEVSANKILIKDLEAKDFVTHVSLNNNMQLEAEDFKFNVAEGSVTGKLKYNLLNNLVNLKLNANNTNAQILAETLFGLKGQIYGNLTGDVDLYCNGKSQDLCTQTLGGEVNFSVVDGRMPKLGSLEYLLKAGNLIKGGITGLTINGIIDLITPYKTGTFDRISGYFHIADGIADKINIYSEGKALNIYIDGRYNFVNMIADLEIFGALTKTFTTLFGKIANASLNTLFNTIPGINISDMPEVITEEISKIPNIENATRTFNAEISGDINGNDYVRSFRWLK